MISIVDKVIAYRKNCGYDYQCFTQYGSAEILTYKLILTSQTGSWDCNQIILWLQYQHGKIWKKNKWKYCKAYIKKLLGVVWKFDKQYQNHEEDIIDL